MWFHYGSFIGDLSSAPRSFSFFDIKDVRAEDEFSVI